jgi:hypothetical protein
MKRLIYKYLSTNYRIRGAKIFQKEKEIFGISSKALIVDINQVLGIPEKNFKWYLKSWIRSQNKGFDFKTYWNPKPFQFQWFPKKSIAQRYLLGVDPVLYDQ